MSSGTSQDQVLTAPAQTTYVGHTHGTAHQVTNFLAMVLPFAAFLGAGVMLWGSLFTWVDLAGLVVAYAATCIGITVGFHRLLTHRSFQTYPAVRYILAVLGTLAIEGSALKWVADHRKHHNFTDEHGDPHSPHGSGPGVLGALKGLWHAHVGWLFNTVGQAERQRYVPDLLKDRGLRHQPRLQRRGSARWSEPRRSRRSRPLRPDLAQPADRHPDHLGQWSFWAAGHRVAAATGG